MDEKGYWRGELWNRRKNGESYASWLTINVVYNEDRSVRYYVELSNDFTEKKEAEDMIWRQANFDFLTNFAESSHADGQDETGTSQGQPVRKKTGAACFSIW